MNSTQIKENILCLNFNQDQALFGVGTDNGFKIFTSADATEKLSRDLKGGVAIVELLYRSNIIALVGGGIQPKYPENKVILWDDNLLKSIGEMSFRDKVKNVKFRNDKLVVVLEKKTFVYNFSDLKLIDQIETSPNSRGMAAINVETEVTILAVPDKVVGKVVITTYGIQKTDNVVKTVNAHQSPISFLALNPSGTKLATASEKGTVIRVYDTLSGESLQELRRGSDYATITSLAFDFNSLWLACASDQGTIHIFSLKEGGQGQQSESTKNPKSKLGFLGNVLPIFRSEWSFAQFRIQDSRSKVIFDSVRENTLIVISSDGNYYQAKFDAEKGGECQKTIEKKFQEVMTTGTTGH